MTIPKHILKLGLPMLVIGWILCGAVIPMLIAIPLTITPWIKALICFLGLGLLLSGMYLHIWKSSRQ